MGASLNWPETMKTESGEEFLIARGGPFFELQRQIGLARENALNSGRRALVFVFLTAVVPVALAFLTHGAVTALSILKEPDFLARFVLFVAICFLMERSLETRLKNFLERFDDSGLLDEVQRQKSASAVARALKLRNLATADAVCLALAIVASIASLRIRLADGGGGWIMEEIDGTHTLSIAGWWITTVSSAIFWFLVFRWLWRILIWAILLSWISRLDMRLVATHPDRFGGLGFIAAYPNAFAPLIFAMSSVPAAAAFKKLNDQTMDVATYGTLMTAWLALVLAVFMLPLLSFSRPLSHLKATTLKEADILSTLFQRASERKVFNRNLSGPPDEAIAAEVPDPSAIRKAATSLRTVPFSRNAVLPLSVAALAPLLIAGATQLPFKDLLKTAKSLLIL